MEKSTDILFQYLCDIVYNVDRATLSLEELDEEHQMLGKGLIYLQSILKEQLKFALELARGNLSVALPPADNELAAPLKSLHASLRHLSWQSQQVARGDYKQIVNFMGEFSEAFNTMTRQLDSRQKELEQEIEMGRKKTAALEQSNEILTHITLNSVQMIMVFDEETEEMVYRNNSAEAKIKETPLLLQNLRPLIKKDGTGNLQSETEINIENGEREQHFTATIYRLLWGGNAACAIVVQDITREKQNLQKLEFHANRDELTGLNNRHAGMEVLHKWLEQKKTFVICFFDLDNLKYVNDTYGHDEGDNYIVESSKLIRRSFENSVSCRLGGDEFMLLVQNITRKEAENRIQAFCDEFAKGETTYQRRISYGCAEVLPGNKKTAKQLLSLADGRMYEFKRRQKAKNLFP